MNNLSILNSALTMSSTEIAALTGKEHKNVIADIRIQIFVGLYEFSKEKMAEKSAINEIQGVTVNLDNRGYWSEVLLDRYHTDILISGYEVKYRAAIVRRWHELEAAQSAFNPANLTRLQLLEMAMQSEKEKLLLESKIEADKPKVEFAEIVTEDSNTRCVRVWVKAMKHENNLTVGERRVFKWLMDNRYIFKDSVGYLPRAKYEANGANYFTMVIDDINGKPRRQLKITGKGVVALTGKVVKAFANAGVKSFEVVQ